MDILPASSFINNGQDSIGVRPSEIQTNEPSASASAIELQTLNNNKESPRTSEKGQLGDATALNKLFANSRRAEERVRLVWNNLNYSILTKDSSKSKLFAPVYKEKIILKDCTGYAETGQLLAIMGPTGCGKTSLLNILAARAPGNNQSLGSLKGAVTVNGKARDEQAFRAISAYVLQDDYMYPHLTVAETFSLAANFYLPDGSTDAQRDSLVDAVLAELGLIKARDTIIGDEKTRGVSGGERRRASIGVQLISDPAVLFLDEPTSGLDSFQALAVMDSMKTMAANGRLIVSVIHQPRSSIFYMFDKLLLLTEGRSVFFGDSNTAVDYFTKLGYNCPEAFNPSDYFLDILSPDNRSPDLEKETRNRINHIIREWAAHQKNTAADRKRALTQMDSQMQVSLQDIKTIGSGEITLQRRFRNFVLLSWRSSTEQRRDTFTIRIKFIVAIVFSLILGGIYSNIGDSQQSIQNRFGLLFFMVLNQMFNSVIAVFNVFPKEKNIVNRERATNAYDALSYYCAKVVVETPLNMLPILFYGCILYYMVELNPNRFGLFLLIIMYTNFTAITLGLAISAVAPTSEAAIAFGLPLLIISVLFGGFYIKISSLAIVLNWFPYISLLRWGFQALTINEFQGLKFACDSPNLSSCILTGEQALETLAFDNHSVSYPIFGLSMCMLGFIVVGYINLYRSKPEYLPLNTTGSTFATYLSSHPASELGLEVGDNESVDDTEKERSGKYIQDDGVDSKLETQVNLTA